MVDTFEKAKQSSLKTGENQLRLLQKKIEQKNEALQTLIDAQEKKLVALQNSIKQENDSIQHTQEKYESVLHEIQSFHQKIADAENKLLALDEQIQSTQQNASFMSNIEELESELHSLKTQHTTKIHEYEQQIEFFFAVPKND